MSDHPAPEDSGGLADSWSDSIPKTGEAKPFDADVYFDDRGGFFYRRDSQGRYIKASVSSCRRFLKTLGFSAKSVDGLPSDLDRVLEFIETNQNVKYAASLAGYPAGARSMGGKSVLVTESPRLIESAAGSWSTLRAIFEGLLGEEQAVILYRWLKVAVESVRSSRNRPGQALVIAGPPRCGKSLCQAIITELLGGRVALPFAYLCGRTEFNSELFQAEHLVIEDEAASSDPRVRKKFGSEIKGLTANRNQKCHAKNREALTLRPIWRVSITLNDDPASLLVLPQLEHGLRDKLILLHARAFEMPVDTSTETGEEMLWRQLTAELPAFQHHLDGLNIPEDCRDARYGLAAYHNPDLIELMDSATDEMKLLELIDTHLFDSPCSGEWEGLAAELEEKLRDECGAATVGRLFYHNTACGQLLGELRRRMPNRVDRRILHGRTLWKIRPPETDND